jgi:hypothetical protein
MHYFEHHMSVVHFGTETEYVKIKLPGSYCEKGWAQAEVEIAVQCFNGSIRPWLDAEDMVPFTVQLRALYETLNGEAALSPRDEQFTLRFVGTVGGHIEVNGVAWSDATYGNELTFFLGLDQTFLPAPLQVIEGLLPAKQNDV